MLDSTWQPSGSFVASVAIVGNGEACGGGFYEQVAVRLCVKYAGVNDLVDMADTNCPSGLPASVSGVQVCCGSFFSWPGDTVGGISEINQGSVLSCSR